MIVSGKNSLKTRKLYRERSERAIEYARKQIEESAVAPYVSKLYLYGSCVREEQTYFRQSYDSGNKGSALAAFGQTSASEIEQKQYGR